MMLHKKDIKQLVLASYTKDVLDSEKVIRITSLLKRSQLKQYIQMLKMNEQQKKVIVLSAQPLEDSQKQKILQTFRDKHVEYEVDTSLIAGIKIIDNDLISEFNVKNTLENLKAHIESL